MTKIKNTMKGIKKKSKKLILSLSATPNHICFKDYEEGKIYKEQIRILNKDLKSYHVAITFDNPDEIKLINIGNGSKTQINGGDDLVLEIQFCPNLSYKKESVDRRYEICLHIINANTKLFIPIVVLSRHPNVNFPKEISLPDIALNTPAYGNIFAMNYTKEFFKFSFEFRNDMKIIPECKVIGLKPFEGSSYVIEFIPKAIGKFREKIYICVDNDRRMSVMLKCNVIPINIFLNEEIAEFSPTFIGMSDRKSIHIVNNSEDATFFEWLPYECLTDDGGSEVTTTAVKENLQAYPSLKYLEIFPMSGELQPNTITTIELTFKPEDTNDDDGDNDIRNEILLTFALKLSIAPNYHPTLKVKAKILGPSFQLDKKIAIIDELYIGERRDIDVIVMNTGIISGRIFFQKVNSSNGGIVNVSPKSEVLKAGDSKRFKIQFLARKAGKFVEQAYFKVKNGEKLLFSIQGIVNPLNLIVEPKSVKFSSHSICVPQMHFLKLKNPHPFDLQVTIEIEHNGSDEPLEFMEFFKSNDSTSNGSISKSPSSSSSSSSDMKKNLSMESCSSLLTRTSIKNFMERSGRISQLRDTLVAANDGIVMIFNKVNDYLEKKEIVGSIIRVLYDNKLNDEIEKRHISETILELLIENINDGNFIHFHEKEWQFPENPRQIECNKMCFKLSAAACDEIKIFLTPNNVGKFMRNLRFHLSMCDTPASSSNRLIEASIKNIQIQFECHAAELKIHSQSTEITGFAESEIVVEILIENISAVDGFFTLPRYQDTQMVVKCADEKFHMPAGDRKIINLHVTPLMSGQMLKYVNIMALGSNRKFPICIECKSLPPDIVIKPHKISLHDLSVLKQHDTRIFIENRSTTKARFLIKLEHDNECFSINPRGGILSSKQCVMVMLEKFFYDPGDYRDVLIVEIVNSKVIKIPIKCTVKKLPITIEPSFSTVIDFGTLFVSKTQYFLDYTLTNRGKIPYMIFIMLKTWRNRNEIAFAIEPNRFELAPNSSQVVKFLLNAESALCAEEDFTIEGCSVHLPIRELIWESKLKASVIKPTINFTQNELIFNCYYGGVKGLAIGTIEIANKSCLSLPIALKVEGEFAIFSNELNLCEQKVKFELNAKDSRGLQIAFDTKLIENANTFSTCEGIVKAYSLGKLQCTLKLIANLNYPEIELSSNVVQFTANLLPCTFGFVIRNPNEKLSSSFTLKLDETSTKITPIQENRQDNLLNIVQCLMKQKNSLKDEFFNETNDDEYYTTDSDNEENSQKSCEILKNSSTIEVTTNEILKRFKSLASEIQCDRIENLQRKSSGVSTTDVRAENFLLLSHMNGTLKPNEWRFISIKFSGSKQAFHLSTIITCSVEGGRPQDVHINLTNCNPNILVTKTYFDTSSQPWNEIAINNICISNISSSLIDIKLIVGNDLKKKMDERRELIEGYAKLGSKSRKNFTLDEQRNFCVDLKFSIFSGCQPVFKHEFGIQVNNNPPIPITFHGKNSLPMATLLDVDRKSLREIDKSFEYDCLREMFNKCVDRIRTCDEIINFDDILKAKLKLNAIEPDLSKVQRKSIKRDAKRKSERTRASNAHKTKANETIDNLSAGDSHSGLALPKEFGLFYDDDENGKVLWRENPHRIYSGKLLQLADDFLEECDFLALDYPDEYPHSTEIINFIAQHGFVKSLANDDEIFTAYKNIYNRHTIEKFRRAKQRNVGGRANVKMLEIHVDDELVVEPLPLVLSEYSIDFGEIKIDDIYERIVQVYFHHDSMAVAFRTETFIPNFSIKFHQKSEINDLFRALNYRNECNGKYMNRHERKSLADDDDDVENAEVQFETVKHCHSFDFIRGNVHVRKTPGKMERKEIHRIYNEMCSTKEKVEKVKRNPYVLTEIFQKCPFECDETRIAEYKIVLNPQSYNYDDGMTFDEIIYMDIHLGPQIPLHITGKITQ